MTSQNTDVTDTDYDSKDSELKPAEAKGAAELPPLEEAPTPAAAPDDIEPLSEDHAARSKTVFTLLDTDKNGTLEKNELAKIAELLFQQRDNKVLCLWTQE